MWTGLFAFNNRNVYSHPSSLPQLHRDQLPQKLSRLLGALSAKGVRLQPLMWNKTVVKSDLSLNNGRKVCLREIPEREVKKSRRQSWM